MRLVSLGSIAQIRQGIATSGRAAGAKKGDWELRVVSVGDIVDEKIATDILSWDTFVRTWRVEEHLLRPDDVLVSARTTLFKTALVPPGFDRAVANATLLVVRPNDEWIDLGPYLWCYLNSSVGRREAEARMIGSTTLRTLSASALEEIALPIPAIAELRSLAELIETGEIAYSSEIAAARLRRQVVHDFVVQRTQNLPTVPDGETDAAD